jgi:hypothetical protein
MTPFRTVAVVVRWRGGDEVDRCLRSLLRHGGRELERVTLVDSGSADGGRRLAAFPRSRSSPRRSRSFAFAANRGETAPAPACSCSTDTELSPGAVDT